MNLVILAVLSLSKLVTCDLYEDLIKGRAGELNVQNFFKDPILLQEIEESSTIYKLPTFSGNNEVVYKRQANESEQEIVVFSKSDSDKNIYVVLRKNVLATRPTYYATYAYVRDASPSDPASQTISVENKRLFVEWDTWGDRRDNLNSLVWTSCRSTIFLTCGLNSNSTPTSSASNQKASNVKEKEPQTLKTDGEDYLLFKDLDFRTVSGKGRSLFGLFGGSSSTKTVYNVKTILHPFYVQQQQMGPPIYAQPMPMASPYASNFLQQLIPPPPIQSIVPPVYPSFLPNGVSAVFPVPPMLSWVGYHISGNYIPDDTRFRPVHGFLTPNPAGNPTTFIPDSPALAVFLPMNQGTTGVFIPDGYALGANCHGAMLPSIYPGMPFLFVPNSAGFPGWFFPDNGAPRFHGFQIPGGHPGAPSSFIPDPSAFDLNPMLHQFPVSGTFQSDMPAGGTLIYGAGNIRVHGTLVPTMNLPSVGAPHMFIPDALGSPGFFRPDDANLPPVSGMYVTGAQGSPPSFMPSNTPNWPGNAPVQGSFVPSDKDAGVVPCGVDNVRGQVVFGKDKTKPMFIPEENGDPGTFVPKDRQIPPVKGYHVPGADSTPGVFVPSADVGPISHGLTPGVFNPDETDADTLPVDGFIFKTPTKYLLIPKGLGSVGNFFPSDKNPIHGVLISGQHNLFYPDTPSRKSGAWLGQYQPEDPPGPPIPGYMLGVANSQEPHKFLPNTNVYPGSFYPDNQDDKPIRGYFVTGTLGSPGKFIPDPETPVEVGKPSKGTFQPENTQYPKVTCTIMPSKKGIPPRFIPDEDSVPGTYSPDNNPKLSIHGTLVPNKQKEYPSSFIPDDPDIFRDNFPHQIQPGHFQPDDAPDSIRGQMVPNMWGQSPIFIMDPMGIPGTFFVDKHNNFSMTGVLISQKDQNNFGQLYIDDDRFLGTLQPLETTKGIFNPDKYLPGYPVHGKFTPQNPGSAPTFEVLPKQGGFKGTFYSTEITVHGVYFPTTSKTFSKFFPDQPFTPINAVKTPSVHGQLVLEAYQNVKLEGKMKLSYSNSFLMLFKTDTNDKLPKYQPQQLPPDSSNNPNQTPGGAPQKIQNKQAGSPGWFYPQSNLRNRVHGILVIIPNSPVQFQPDSPEEFSTKIIESCTGSIVLDAPQDRTPLLGFMEIPGNPGQPPIFIPDTPDTNSGNQQPGGQGVKQNQHNRPNGSPPGAPTPSGKPGKFYPDDIPKNTIHGYLNTETKTFVADDEKEMTTKLNNKQTTGIFVWDDMQEDNPQSGTLYPPPGPGKPVKFVPKTQGVTQHKIPCVFVPDNNPNRQIKGTFNEDTNSFEPDNPSDITVPIPGTIQFGSGGGPGDSGPGSSGGGGSPNKGSGSPGGGGGKYPNNKGSGSPGGGGGKYPNNKGSGTTGGGGGYPNQETDYPGGDGGGNNPNQNLDYPGGGGGYPNTGSGSPGGGGKYPNTKGSGSPGGGGGGTYPNKGSGSPGGGGNYPNKGSGAPSGGGTYPGGGGTYPGGGGTYPGGGGTYPGGGGTYPGGGGTYPGGGGTYPGGGGTYPGGGGTYPGGGGDNTNQEPDYPGGGGGGNNPDGETDYPGGGGGGGYPNKGGGKYPNKGSGSPGGGGKYPNKGTGTSGGGGNHPNRGSGSPGAGGSYQSNGVSSPGEVTDTHGVIYPPKGTDQQCPFIPKEINNEPTDPNGQPGYFYPDRNPGNPVQGKLNPKTNMFTPDYPEDAIKKITQPSPGRIVRDPPQDETPVPGTLSPPKVPGQPMRFVVILPGGQVGNFYPDKSPNKPLKGVYYPPTSNTPFMFQPDDLTDKPTGPGRLVLEPPNDPTPIPGSLETGSGGGGKNGGGTTNGGGFGGPGGGSCCLMKFVTKDSKTNKDTLQTGNQQQKTGSTSTFFLDENPYFPHRGTYDSKKSPPTFVAYEPSTLVSGPGKIVRDPPDDPTPIPGTLSVHTQTKTATFTTQTKTTTSTTKTTKTKVTSGNPKHPPGGHPTWFYPDGNPKGKIHGSYYPPNTFYPDNALNNRNPLSGVLVQEPPEDPTPFFGSLQPSGTDQPATFLPNNPSEEEPEEPSNNGAPETPPPPPPPPSTTQKGTPRPCWFYPDSNPTNKIRGTYYQNVFTPDKDAKPVKAPTPGLLIPDPPDQTPIHGKLYPSTSKPGPNQPLPFKLENRNTNKQIVIKNNVSTIHKHTTVTTKTVTSSSTVTKSSITTTTVQRNPNAKIDSTKNMQFTGGTLRGVFYSIDTSNIFIPMVGTTGYFVYENGQKVHGSFYPFEQGPANFVPDSPDELKVSGAGYFYIDIATYYSADSSSSSSFKSRTGISGSISISQTTTFLFTATETFNFGSWYAKPTVGCFSFDLRGLLQLYDAAKQAQAMKSTKQQKERGAFYNSTDGQSIFVPDAGQSGQFMSDTGIPVTGVLSTTKNPSVCNFVADDVNGMRNRFRETLIHGIFTNAESNSIAGSLSITPQAVSFNTDVVGVKGSYIRGTEGTAGFMIYCTVEDTRIYNSGSGRSLDGTNAQNSDSENDDPDILSKRPDIASGWKIDKQNEKFKGMGDCPFKIIAISSVESDEDLVDFYTTILRTYCLPQMKSRLKKLVSQKILQVDNQVFVLGNHEIVTRPKLTEEELSDLSTAFEMSMFSQTYKDLFVEESSMKNNNVSHSTYFLVQMGLKAIAEAKEKVQTHHIHLIRNVILTMNTAFAKLCHNPDNEAELATNYNDKVYLMGFIQYALHSENIPFQQFFHSNSEYINWKVDLGCNLLL